MENASKALIIAGAILISILLISVGVMIISSTDGITDSTGATMTEYEISTFNSKFLNYEGDNQKASNVKQLISAISNSNTSNGAESSDDEKYVEIVLKPKSGTEMKLSDTNVDIDNIRKAINSTSTYTVTCDIQGNTGLVYKVTIKEK